MFFNCEKLGSARLAKKEARGHHYYFHTLPNSHSRTIGAFTNDLLHKTTYIPIKLALFWVMLGSWAFESKQILIWLFQRGIIQLCRSKGCQMTSPQSSQPRTQKFGVLRHLRRRRVLAELAPIPPNSVLLPDFEGWQFGSPWAYRVIQYLYGKLLTLCNWFWTKKIVIVLVLILFLNFLTPALLHNQGKGRFVLSTAVCSISRNIAKLHIDALFSSLKLRVVGQDQYTAMLFLVY